MNLKVFGTRGSVPISNKDSIEFGGNTTCIRIFDDSIPEKMALILDAGSGFLPMGQEIIKNNIREEISILFSHWHHDHTMGLFLSPLTFIKKFQLNIFGPVDKGIGPKQMMEHLMKPPFFPVDVREIRSHFSYHPIEFPKSMVILVHKNGISSMELDEYEDTIKNNDYLKVGKGKYPLKEFIIVKMYCSKHPELCISYRFENMDDGKIFVFLTDNENEDGIPTGLKNHVKDADLLIIDSQYRRETYDNGQCGFGHGTADYAVKLALKGNVKKLGLSHHDPSSTDQDVKEILQEAVSHRDSMEPESSLEIFACEDYMEIKI